MPIRGENIGAAFVRLIIDGDRVPRGVEEALEEADGEFDAAGRRQGEIHARALRRSMTDNGLTNADADAFTERLRNRIDAGMVTLGTSSGSSFFERFRTSVIAEMGDGRLADQMIANFERDFARSGFNADFTEIFGIDEGTTRASAAATREWTSRIEEATRALQQQDVQLDRDITLLRQRLRTMRTETERVTRGQLREFEHLTDAIRGTRTELVDLDREFVRLGANLPDAEYREFQRNINAMNRQLGSPIIITYERNLDRIGTSVGRIFGRGSRSELLNFFGTISEIGTRGFLKLGSAVLKTGAAVGDFVREFANAAEGTSRFGAGMSAFFARFAPAIAALANPAGIAAAIAGVVALSLAMGALASLVAAVVAVIGALVATLAGALVGALGIAAGALLPLVAGIGLAVAGFKSMDEAAKKSLKESLKPLTDQFKELGKVAAENIGGALKESVDGLVKAFDSEPVKLFVDNVSFAVGDVIRMFGEAVESPQFQNFITILGQTLPGQIENLGFAATNFGAGFGGIFLALQPTITDVSEGLANISVRFNEWANSASGQTALTDFFEKAQRALSAIGGLVWNVGEALIELFNGEAGTIGIEIFEKMRDKVQDFVDYLRDPENKEEIDTFFREAEETVNSILSIMGKLSKAFGHFTSKENQDDLQAILGIFDSIAGVIENISSLLSKISIPDTLTTLIGAIPGIGPVINGLRFADGGHNIQAPGWSLVGEEGPELMRIPGGASIYPAAQTAAMTRNSNVNIEIRNYGPQTGADMKDQIDWNLRYGSILGPTSALAG